MLKLRAGDATMDIVNVKLLLIFNFNKKQWIQIA
jgi:hypothetical protein